MKDVTLEEFKVWLKEEYPDNITFRNLLDYWANKFYVERKRYQ